MTNKFPKIAVVTPAYNDLQSVLSFIDSLKKTKYPNLSIIIIDDGSTDDTAKVLVSKYPEVTVLKGDGNLWWSGSTNLGVKEAIASGADYVYTINNDVIVDKNVFSSLITCAKDHPKTLIGCKILYLHRPKETWYFGAFLSDKIADIDIKRGNESEYNQRIYSDILTGMGVLVPIEVFKTAGIYYDAEAFPQYFADSDFSLRAGKAGFDCMVDPASKIYSDVDSSWVNKQLEKPRVKFLWECYFAARSPYSVKVRYIFYKRYWTNYRRMLLKFYALFGYNFVLKGFIPKYLATHVPGFKPLFSHIKSLKKRVS